MKACEAYIEQMILSLDGELSPQAEQKLQEHLAGCEGCRSLYKAYQEIDQGIAEMEEEPPEGLVRAVMGSVRREHEKGQLLKRYRFTLIAAAAAVVVLIAGKYFPSYSAQSAASADTAAEEVATEAAASAAAGEMAFQAQFEAQDETAEITEAEPEEAVVTESEPVEEAAAEDQTASGSTAPTISEVFDALHQDGYSGDLYGLDMTEKELLEVLPDCDKLTLSSGTVVYQTDQDTFYGVQEQLVYSSSIVLDGDSTDVFLLLKN
jgi:anti-sigma factor RsiW